VWCQFWHLSLSADLANDPCFVSDVPLSALQSTHSFRCVYIFPAAVALPASTLGSGGRAVWAGCEDKEGVFAYACLATQTAAYTILSLKSSSSSLCTWNLAWMLQESSHLPTYPGTSSPLLFVQLGEDLATCGRRAVLVPLLGTYPESDNTTHLSPKAFGQEYSQD
jgi:hypothetical protein